MTELDQIEEDLAALSEQIPVLFRDFYARLYAAHPHTQVCFGSGSMVPRKQMLNQMLSAVHDHARGEDWLPEYLAGMSTLHHDWDVTACMYDALVESLIAALGANLGPSWNAEGERVWRAHLDAICQRMKTHGTGAPDPWWAGEE